MKRNIYLLFFLLANAHAAENCLNENSSLNSLGPVLVTCVPEDLLYVSELSEHLQETTEFCKNKCKDPLNDLRITGDEEKAKQRNMMAKATMDELQKQLTMVVSDLMKVRSSYRISFSADKTIKACDIEKGLKKPKCMPQEEFNKFTLPLKNALATEMANILTDSTSKASALYKRTPNEKIDQCKINDHILSDKQILDARMHYQETLLTAEYFQKMEILFNSTTEKNKSYHDIKSSNRSLDKALIEANQELAGHPLFGLLLGDRTKFLSFLKEVKKAGTSQQKIIELLYSPKFTSQFGEKTASHCQQAFELAAKSIEDSFCSKNSIVPDNFKSFTNVYSLGPTEMADEKLEMSLKDFCSTVNQKTSSDKSFSEIMASFSKLSNESIADLPIENFKRESYEKTIETLKTKLCDQKNADACKTKDGNPLVCQTLDFINLSDKDENYKKLAQSSNEDINLVLRSLVGTGAPQKDGAADLDSYALLQKEGILPGGEPQEKPAQPDVETFHKTVNSNSNGPTLNQNQKITNSDGTSSHSKRKIASVDEPSESEGSTGSNFAYSKNKSGNDAVDPEFSSLDEDEQQKFMDRLGRMRNGKKSKKNDVGQAPGIDPVLKKKDKAFFARKAEDGNIEGDAPTQDMPSFAGNSGQADLGSNGGVTSGSSAGGTNAGVNGKGFRSINNAIIGANEFRGGAQTNGETPIINELSKTKTGENEINIQVEDEELAKVKEFNEDLKKLLAVHNEELALVKVGEKFVVKLNDYLIDVYFDQKTGLYKAECRNGEISEAYKTTISHYFNVTLKQGPGKIKELNNAFQVSKKN